MKKKAYMTPAIEMEGTELELPIAVSVGGDSGIQMGDGVVPTTADSRSNIWDYSEDE